MGKIDYYKGKFSNEVGNSYIFRSYEFTFLNLFRGRKFKDKSLEEVEKELFHIDKMWSPPSCQAPKGRCNRENQPVLYLSSHISSIPKEIEAEGNDLIAVIEYEMHNYIKSISLLGHDELLKVENNNFYEIIKNHYKGIPDKAIQYDKEYSAYFKERRDLNLKYDIYDKTIALTELFFMKSIGIIYPSVAVEYNSFNLVFKPEVVMKIFNPVKVFIGQIIGENSNICANIKRLSYGKFNNFGCIEWIDQEKDFCYIK